MPETVVPPIEDQGRALADDRGRHREPESTEHVAVPEEDIEMSDTTKLSPETVSIFDRRLSNVRRTLEAKSEARRQRRSLKESGDYLGVQGINPVTGQLDVITPTESEQSSVSDDTLQRINTIRRTLRDAKDSYKEATAWTEREMKKILVVKERAKCDKLQKEKKKHHNIIQAVKWRRNTKQWSSVHEPNLSPITQSQTSVDTSSRRPSKQVKLVDFVPLGRSQPEAEETESETKSQDSANTTIRTPHRRSLANTSGYAMELFENGISFDHPNNKPLLQSQGGHQLLANNCQDLAVTSPTSQPTAPEIPSLCVTTPRNFTSRLSFPTASDQAGSFLELPDPHRPNSKFPENLWDPARTLISSKGAEEDLTSAQGTVRRRMKMDHADSTIPSATKETIVMPSSPSRRRRLARRALHSMTNLRNHHEPLIQLDEKITTDASVPEEIAQNTLTALGQPLTKDRIQQDLMHLRSKVSKLKQQKAVSEPLDRDQCLTDHEWIEDTIRDITQKGKQIVAGCASTPITTTTGSDQAMSQLSQRDIDSQPRRQVIPSKRPLNRILYNLPIVDSPKKRRELQTNLFWNTSAKLSIAPAPDTTGTISTSHLAVTKQRTEKIIRHVQSTARARSVDELIMDSSPKSTSSTEENEAPRSNSANVQRQERQHPDMADTKLGNADIAKIGTMIARGEVSNRDERVTNYPIQYRAMMEQDLVRLPGSYPIHPDDVAAIEHLSQIRSEGVAIDDMDGRGPIRILFVYAILLMSMYWEVVGPVFNRRSDYWERSARGESTIADGCAVLLALPTAVVGMTGLL